MRIESRVAMWVVVALAGVCVVRADESRPRGRDVLFQVSTIDAALEGLYDGVMPILELGRHGDFGLGTFDQLDGEMIAIDGHFFRSRSDGKVLPVGPEVTTPFAVVTTFHPEKTVAVGQETSLASLQRRLDAELPSMNIFHAIRLDGTFASVKVRSVPRQKKPYPRLTAVVDRQPVNTYSGVRGTLLGFRCPYFVKGANVPGYHLHFISDDRTRGGHVLDLVVSQGTLATESITDFSLRLPNTPVFLKANFQKDLSRELEKVEKGK